MEKCEYKGFEETLTLDRGKSRFDTTLHDLGLARKDLNNKIILDAGSGPAYLAEIIEAEAMKEDPEFSAKIFSLDPKYDLKLLESMEKEGKKVRDIDYAKKAVAKIKEQKLQALSGLCENLPFKNDSVDLVLSYYSVFYYAHEKYKEQFEKMLKEMIRITKDKGEIRIYPMNSAEQSDSGLVNDILKNEKNIIIDIPKDNEELLIIRKNLEKQRD